MAPEPATPSVTALSRRYLRHLAGGCALLLLLAAALAVVVDPYYVFDAPRIAGFNTLKPRSVNQGEIAKLMQAPRVCARTLVLGNSRLEVGIDPDSTAWPSAALPVFNGASAGTGPDFALRLLRTVLPSCTPRLIVLQVDFADILATRTSPQLDEPLNWRERATAMLNATLTGDALVDTLATIMGQHSTTAVHLTPAGFNPAAHLRAEVALSGANILFVQKEVSYAKALRAASRPTMTAARNAGLNTIRTLVALASAHAIEVVVVLPPYHVRYLDLIRDTGRQPDFLSWKAAVTALVADATAQGGRVRLVDAATRHTYAREAVPAPGDRRTEMQYYWEAGHFKKALGDLLLGAVFGSNTFSAVTE